MKYYRIEESIDTKEIGLTYPQIQEAEYTCDPFEDKAFIENVGYEKVDFTPKLPIGKLHKKAKLTDLLSAVPNGYTRRLLISDKLKNSLPNSKNHQLFEAKIMLNKSRSIDYWVLNPINFDYENIDFSKSEFYLMKGVFDKVKKLNIKTIIDFKEELKRIGNIGHPYRLRILNIQIKDFILNNKDFIIMDNVKGGINYFVSERLKKILENDGITGIKFEEV